MVRLGFPRERAVLGPSDSLGPEVLKASTFWWASGGWEPAHMGSDKMTFTVSSGRDWSGRDDRTCLGSRGPALLHVSSTK